MHHSKQERECTRVLVARSGITDACCQAGRRVFAGCTCQAAAEKGAEACPVVTISAAEMGAEAWPVVMLQAVCASGHNLARLLQRWG